MLRNPLKRKTFVLDFIVLGAQKSGTSALDYYLRQHPEIEMPNNVKELHFFDTDRHFSKKKVNYKPLEAHFNIQKNTVCGEITPSYLYWKPAIKRIQQHNPNCKLIILLRNPIDRAFSHYNMQVVQGEETQEFYHCICNEERRIAAGSSQTGQNRNLSYKSRGLYYNQLLRVFEHFPKTQVLVIKYDDFLANQQACLKQVFDFLDIDSSYASTLKQRTTHKLPYGNIMDQKSKHYLSQYFKTDITQVETLLGWDCSDWKT